MQEATNEAATRQETSAQAIESAAGDAVAGDGVVGDGVVGDGVAGGVRDEAAGAIELVTARLTAWYEVVVSRLPNGVVAILVLVIFWFLARLVRRLVERTVLRVAHNPMVASLLASTAMIATVAVGLFIALGILGLDKTVTSLLAGAGVVGLALAFAFQDIAANFMAGVLISIRRPYHVGDLVEIDGHFGTVEKVDLRNTILHTPGGQAVLVPNKESFENVMINYSMLGVRRVDVTVGVSYGDDLEAARRVAIAAVEGVEGRSPERPVELFYEQFGASSIDFVVRFWIPFARQSEYLAARSAAIMAIKSAFDEHGITIPFPIRTLDFGIVGGMSLDEVISPRVQPSGDGAAI